MKNKLLLTVGVALALCQNMFGLILGTGPVLMVYGEGGDKSIVLNPVWTGRMTLNDIPPEVKALAQQTNVPEAKWDLFCICAVSPQSVFNFCPHLWAAVSPEGNPLDTEGGETYTYNVQNAACLLQNIDVAHHNELGNNAFKNEVITIHDKDMLSPNTGRTLIVDPQKLSSFYVVSNCTDNHYNRTAITYIVLIPPFWIGNLSEHAEDLQKVAPFLANQIVKLTPEQLRQLYIKNFVGLNVAPALHNRIGDILIKNGATIDDIESDRIFAILQKAFMEANTSVESPQQDPVERLMSAIKDDKARDRFIHLLLNGVEVSAIECAIQKEGSVDKGILFLAEELDYKRRTLNHLMDLIDKNVEHEQQNEIRDLLLKLIDEMDLETISEIIGDGHEIDQTVRVLAGVPDTHQQERVIAHLLDLIDQNVETAQREEIRNLLTKLIEGGTKIDTLVDLVEAAVVEQRESKNGGIVERCIRNIAGDMNVQQEFPMNIDQTFDRLQALIRDHVSPNRQEYIMSLLMKLIDDLGLEFVAEMVETSHNIEQCILNLAGIPEPQQQERIANHLMDLVDQNVEAAQQEEVRKLLTKLIENGVDVSTITELVEAAAVKQAKNKDSKAVEQLIRSLDTGS